MYIALLNAGSNALRGKYTTLALIIITIAAAIIDNWPIPELANIVKSIFFKKTPIPNRQKTIPIIPKSRKKSALMVVPRPEVASYQYLDIVRKMAEEVSSFGMRWAESKIKPGTKKRRM